MAGPVVVTGVNGHIGNNLARDLLANGYSVRGTVRDMSKAPEVVDDEPMEAELIEDDSSTKTNS